MRKKSLLPLLLAVLAPALLAGCGTMIAAAGSSVADSMHANNCAAVARKAKADGADDIETKRRFAAASCKGW